MCHVLYVRSEEDLERFFDLYYKSFVGFVRNISSLTYDDAQDVVQESCKKALERIDTYDTQRPFKPWFYRILYNETINWYRRNSLNPLILVEPIVLEQIIAEASIEDPLIEDDQAECEAKTIMQMEAVLNLIRLLFRCGGYPHEQMAFTYAKVIHGKLDKKRNLYINAKEMDEKYGSVSLFTLVNDCPAHWKKEIRARVKYLLKSVKQRMEEKAGVLVKTDKIPDNLYDTPVKNTCWRDYYPAKGHGNNHPLTEWCSRVVTRLREILNVPEISDMTEKMAATKLKNGSCVHCKLRHVPVLGCPVT